ncbi:hypothetical protein AAMO2058_001231000 [Amorphochlora amoebiformis]
MTSSPLTCPICTLIHPPPPPFCSLCIYNSSGYSPFPSFALLHARISLENEKILGFFEKSVISSLPSGVGSIVGKCVRKIHKEISKECSFDISVSLTIRGPYQECGSLTCESKSHVNVLLHPWVLSTSLVDIKETVETGIFCPAGVTEAHVNKRIKLEESGACINRLEPRYVQCHNSRFSPCNMQVEFDKSSNVHSFYAIAVIKNRLSVSLHVCVDDMKAKWIQEVRASQDLEEFESAVKKMADGSQAQKLTTPSGSAFGHLRRMTSIMLKISTLRSQRQTTPRVGKKSGSGSFKV